MSASDRKPFFVGWPFAIGWMALMAVAAVVDGVAGLVRWMTRGTTPTRGQG